MYCVNVYSVIFNEPGEDTVRGERETERETETPWKRESPSFLLVLGREDSCSYPAKTGRRRPRRALGEGTVERFLWTGRRRST